MRVLFGHPGARSKGVPVVVNLPLGSIWVVWSGWLRVEEVLKPHGMVEPAEVYPGRDLAGSVAQTP